MSEAKYDHLRAPFQAQTSLLDRQFEMIWEDTYGYLMLCLEELREQGMREQRTVLNDRQSLAYDLLLMLEDDSVMPTRRCYSYKDVIEKVDQVELLEEVIGIVKSNDRLTLVPNAKIILARYGFDVSEL